MGWHFQETLSGKKYLFPGNSKNVFSRPRDLATVQEHEKCCQKLVSIVRVRVIRERLSATPGHVIGQGPAPGGWVVPRGRGGGDKDLIGAENPSNFFNLLSAIT